MSNRVYLLLGGNQGDVLENLSKAKKEIELYIGEIQCMSPIYKTEPWGLSADELFFNQVIYLETSCSPQSILVDILEIEKRLGRIRKKGKLDSRPIDIDILFYNDIVLQTPELTIPHPRLHLRNFTLVPLNDISPHLVHPVLQKTIQQLLKNTTDKHWVSQVTN